MDRRSFLAAIAALPIATISVFNLPEPVRGKLLAIPKPITAHTFSFLVLDEDVEGRVSEAVYDSGERQPLFFGAKQFNTYPSITFKTQDFELIKGVHRWFNKSINSPNKTAYKVLLSMGTSELFLQWAAIKDISTTPIDSSFKIEFGTWNKMTWQST